jgi:putative membrane protein
MCRFIAYSTFGVVLGVLFLSSTPTRAADDRQKLSDTDMKFIMNAAKGGKMEVDLGKLAKDKAGSQDVKDFGQKMVDDHSKANDQLKDLAKKKDVELKDKSDKDDEAQKMMDHLSSLSGADFDKAYMKHMVEDHEKDVKEFEEASNSASDADLKKWASDTLPILKQHLQLAKDVQDKVGK